MTAAGDVPTDHGYACKRCGGPSPMGIGYLADGAEAARLSAPLTVCGCGYSRRTPFLTGPEVAALLGIKPGSWRAMVSDGRAPARDSADAENRSVWDRDRVVAWNDARQGSPRTRANRLRTMVRRATGGEFG